MSGKEGEQHMPSPPPTLSTCPHTHTVGLEKAFAGRVSRGGIAAASTQQVWKLHGATESAMGIQLTSITALLLRESAAALSSCLCHRTTENCCGAQGSAECQESERDVP